MNEFLELSPLFLNSWIGLLLLAFPSAWIGTTLVEKKLSLVTDTYSHALLPGVVISQILFGSSVISLVLGAWLTGLVLALLTWYLSLGKNSLADSRFAFFSLLFIAIGMTISYKFQTSNEILHLLFGNVLLFEQKLNFSLFGLLIIVSFLFLKSKSLWSLWVIDPEVIEQSQLNLKFWGFLILSLSTLYLTLGLYGVGSLMMVGLLVVPPLISRMHFKSLYSRLSASTLLIFISMTAGLMISFIYDLPIGPALVLTLSVFYFLSWILKYLSSQKKTIPVILILLIFSILKPHSAQAKNLNIIASTQIIFDLTQTLTNGFQLEVHSLQNPHRHEHEISLSPRSILNINSESLIIHWGKGIDDRAIKTIKSQFPNNQFCLASANLPLSQDAHYWINPEFGLLIINNIEKCLLQKWPDQKDTLLNNSRNLKNQILELEKRFKEDLNKIPSKNLRFVTTHDAFHQLNFKYGIKYLALYKSDHHQEPSAVHFKQLIKSIESDSYLVFLSDQEILNPLSRRLLDISGIKFMGQLYSDTLPQEKLNESKYLLLLKHNFETLIKAFNFQKDIK